MSTLDPAEDLPADDPELLAGMRRWRALQDADVPDLDERRRLRLSDDDR